MLSKHISSIGLFIVSEMTENPTAKNGKVWCCATLLINFRNFDKVDGKIHDINCKTEKMEQGMANNTFMINSLYERLFALECYSRGFNLRFFKVPEKTGEDCIVTLGKIISKDLKQTPVIENTHRVGPSRDDGSPHPIIAKFLYRPDRRDIL